MAATAINLVARIVEERSCEGGEGRSRRDCEARAVLDFERVAKECAREKEADDVDCAGFCLCRQWSGVEVEGVGCVGGIAQCAGNESPFADGGILEALSLLEAREERSLVH